MEKSYVVSRAEGNLGREKIELTLLHRLPASTVQVIHTGDVRSMDFGSSVNKNQMDIK